MPSGTAVPFPPYSAPHLGAIAHCVCRLHTENTRNRALGNCLFAEHVAGGERVVAEFVGMLHRDPIGTVRAGEEYVDEIMCLMQGTP